MDTKSKFAKNFLFFSMAFGCIAAGASQLMAIDINPDIMKSFFGEALNNQITQAGIGFAVAAWIHSSRVKKEIKANFVGLTDAINNVAESFKEDLKAHAERMDNLAFRVQKIELDLQKSLEITKGEADA